MVRISLAVVALLLVSFPAEGQPGSNNPAAQAFATGTQLFEEGQYLQAVEAFQRSYALHAHFLTLCNIGRCYQRANNMAQAAAFYRRCLQEGGDRSPKAQEIQAALARAESQALAQAEVQLANITIESASGAGTAYINGRAVGETPANVRLKPGTYRIEVRQPSARPARITIAVEAGERRTVVLRPEATAAPEAERARSSQSSDADGKASTKPAQRRLSQAWFWTSAIVTVGLAVTATICGVQTLRANTEYEDQPTKAGYDRVIQRRLITNVLWGAAAAAGGATTALFFFTSFKRAPRPSVEDFAERAPAFGIGVAGQF